MSVRSLVAAALVTGLSVVLLACAQTPTPGVHAHDPQAAPDLRPRVGQISDEVALQRLRMAGIENPRVVRRVGTEIIAQGTLQGRQATLRLDALQGRLVDTAAPSVALAGPGTTVAHPLITGPQLRELRSELSEPILMRDVIRPQP
jgi:hypothetical protein